MQHQIDCAYCATVDLCMHGHLFPQPLDAASSPVKLTKPKSFSTLAVGQQLLACFT